MDTSTPTRGKWGSKIGFILAASGSAVGLGNIWRFPYLTGENGGGAFVFVYLLCVLLIGLPLLWNEVGLGRLTRKNPIGAFQALKKNSFFIIGPILCLLVCFFVLSYYSVIAGWALGFIYNTIAEANIDFKAFIATPRYVIPLVGLFILFTIIIVQGGVSGGIEKASKFLMPVLIILVVVICIKSLSLEGSWAGVVYYLKPDFNLITPKVVIMALGQAFFSLSVGWGLMITYGSYMDKTQNIVSSGVWVAFTDTFIALLGGLMVFPAVFAFGLKPDSGFTLVFEVLPKVFEQMPGGVVVGASFFVLLAIAALTSSISMLEVPVSYLIDEKRWNRRKAAWIVGIGALILGIPSALSFGAVPSLTSIDFLGGNSFFGLMDKFFGTYAVIVISLVLSVFVGWAIKTSGVVGEIGLGAAVFNKPIVGGLTMSQIWVFFIRYIVPFIISIMLINMVLLEFEVDIFSFSDSN